MNSRLMGVKEQPTNDDEKRLSSIPLNSVLDLSDEFSQRILAVDPGAKHCGYATARINGDGINWIDSGTFDPFTFIDVFSPSVLASFDVIICEDYVVRPSTAALQNSVNKDTLKVMGYLEYTCRHVGVPLRYQSPTAKKPADAIRKKTEIEWSLTTDSRHSKDAQLHAISYMFSLREAREILVNTLKYGKDKK